MKTIVRISINGQVTIPKKLREQFGIKTGEKLIVKATKKGILFQKVPRLEDMAGIDANYGTPAGIKKMIDKLREEY